MIERICFILLVNLAFYFRTLKFGYCSDDIPVHANPPPHKNKLQFIFHQIIAYRRTNPKLDHAITTVIQAITCVFVYLGLGHNDVSFLTAMLFSFNPANNQCSIWISGRGYMLVALLLLASMTFQYLSPFFMLCAMYHPAGYFSSLAFLGSPKWYIIISFPFLIWFKLKGIKDMVVMKRGQEAVDEDRKFNFDKIVLAIKTYGFYATLCIIPFRITFYHNFLQSVAGNDIMRNRGYKKDGFFYIGLILLTYMLYSIFNWTPMAWGVWWFSICIAPYTNFVRMQQEIGERYVYLASVGLMFALANLIIGYPFISIAFITAYIVRLWYLAPMYTDDYWLLEYAVAEDPAAWYAWHTRARKRFDQGCIREALNMWVMAKLLSPKEFKVIMNIGVVLKMMNKNDEAEKFFQEAEKYIIPGQEVLAKQIISDARNGKRPICI